MARAVRAYALRRADAEIADDVVSEVFVVACRRMSDVRRTRCPGCSPARVACSPTSNVAGAVALR